MKKLVILSGLIAVIGLSAPASLTFAASKSKSPSVSGPPKVMTKPPAGKTVAKPPGKGDITPRPGKGGVAETRRTNDEKRADCMQQIRVPAMTCFDSAGGTAAILDSKKGGRKIPPNAQACNDATLKLMERCRKKFPQ